MIFAVINLTFIQPPLLRHKRARRGLKYGNIFMDLIHRDPANPLFFYSLFEERSYISAPGLTSDPDNSVTEVPTHGKSRTRLLGCWWWGGNDGLGSPQPRLRSSGRAVCWVGGELASAGTVAITVGQGLTRLGTARSS